jgi:hypothetical protein
MWDSIRDVGGMPGSRDGSWVVADSPGGAPPQPGGLVEYNSGRGCGGWVAVVLLAGGVLWGTELR